MHDSLMAFAVIKIEKDFKKQMRLNFPVARQSKCNKVYANTVNDFKTDNKFPTPCMTTLKTSMSTLTRSTTTAGHDVKTEVVELWLTERGSFQKSP